MPISDLWDASDATESSDSKSSTQRLRNKVRTEKARFARRIQRATKAQPPKEEAPQSAEAGFCKKWFTQRSVPHSGHSSKEWYDHRFNRSRAVYFYLVAFAKAFIAVCSCCQINHLVSTNIFDDVEVKTPNSSDGVWEKTSIMNNIQVVYINHTDPAGATKCKPIPVHQPPLALASGAGASLWRHWLSWVIASHSGVGFVFQSLGVTESLYRSCWAVATCTCNDSLKANQHIHQKGLQNQAKKNQQKIEGGINHGRCMSMLPVLPISLG